MTTTNLSGSDFSGIDSAKLRTYSISSNAINIQVFLDRQFLHSPGDYTFASGLITIVSNLWDSQKVTIIFDTETTTDAGSNYTTNLKIAQMAGIGFEVTNEELGTGDDSNKSFDLDNGNVISDSYTLKYGDATGDDVNDLTELTENTHYTLDKRGGTVLLTSAGVTLVSTDNIYATYTHSPKLDDDIITELNTQVTASVDDVTGNYWGAIKDNHEIFDRSLQSYPSTDRPYISTDPADEETFNLDYKGLRSLTGAYILQSGLNVSDAQNYDLSGLSFTDVTDEINTQENTFIPFAATPAVGDYLYIGLSLRFHGINIVMGVNGVQNGAGSDNIIEYWDGDSWEEISIDNAPNFDGNVAISWDRLGGWTKTSVNSSTELFFIRIKANDTYTTIPKISTIYPNQDFVISKELQLSKITFRDYGEINFTARTLQNGKYKIRVDFTHGYSSVPANVCRLASIIGGMYALLRISGGSYDTPSTYTLGRKSFSIGQLYINIDNTLKQLRLDYEFVLGQVGEKMDVIS